MMCTGFIPRFIKNQEKFSRVFNAVCGLIVIIMGVLLIWRSF
jgi:threonine/homoserine/homoserine lactone efflux protein